MAKAPTSQPSAPTQDAQAAVLDAPAAAHVPMPLVPIGNMSGAVALPADLAAELAAEAKDAAAKERPSVSKISLKSGVMTFMNQPLPGNKIDCVVLTAAFWNKFYEGRYNPSNIVNPTCFAVKLDNGDDMEPHENVENPISEACDGCPNMEWGSDPGGGRGKACKETRRLAVLPADVFKSLEDLRKAEIAVVDVPVTSVRNYGNFVNTLSASVKRPMWSVVTELSVVPDPKTQFKLVFQPRALINDPELLQLLKARVEEAQRAVGQPYDEAYLQGESTEKGTGQGAPQQTSKTSKFRG